MAIKASATITIFNVDDIAGTTRYYKSVASGSSAPSKPTENTDPDSTWETTEPTVDTSKVLYFVDQTLWSNGAKTYSEVSKSSSYEAAKEAYTKAQNAQNTANEAAKTATNYLKFNNGLIVAKDAANWSSGRNVFIDDDSVDIRIGSNMLASYGESIQMYNNAGTRVLTDIGGNGRSLSVYDSSNGRQIVDIGESKLFDTLFTEERFEEATSVSVSNGVITATANFNYTIKKGIFNFIIRSDAIKASLLVNLSDDVNVDKLTRSIVWKSNIKTRLEIAGEFYPATYLDEYGSAEQTIRGNLWIENTGDANGLGYPEPPFGIGTKKGEHLEIDCNEIMAKSGEYTPSQLCLNQEGGNVSINNNCDRSLLVQDGALFAKNKSYNSGKWLGIVDCLNDSGNTTFGYGNWESGNDGIGLTNIYGKQMNLVVRSLPVGVDVGTPNSKDTTKKIMLSKTASGYYGLVNPDGGDESYVRSPKQGIIPYASGGNATHGLTTKIGAEAWPFYSGYFEYLYVTNWIKVGNTKVSLEGHGHAWSEITGKPSSYTPASHHHTAVYSSDDSAHILMGKDTNYYFRPSTNTERPYTYLGSSSHKWKQLYATTTTINTSDLKEKRDVEKLDDKYIQMFDLIEPYSYMTINGDRVHTGFIAQYVEDAMEQVGLTIEELGFLCKDARNIEEEDEHGNILSKTPVLDEDGNQIYDYGLRYSEYIAICVAKIKQQEKRIDELEAKLNALLEKE